jgi:uncharacterized protein (DUF1778 family)
MSRIQRETKPLQILLTEQERQLILAAAALQGHSKMGTFIRMVALDRAREITTKEES